MVDWNDITIVIPTRLGPRERAFHELLTALRGRCHGAQCVVSISTGDSRTDAVRSFETARAVGRPWVLHVEDDAWPSDAITEAVPRHLADATGARSFFSRFRAHDAPGLHRVSTLTYAVAVAVRSEVLDGFAAWALSWYADHPEHYHATDVLLGDWLRVQRVPLAVVSPSLFEHRLGPSTFPGRGRDRRSRTYAQTHGEAPPMPTGMP